MSQPTPEVKTKSHFWFNNTFPLWMPEGSVRAILIILLAGTMAGILLKFAAMQEEIPATVSKIMEALLPALVLLIKDYMNTRAKQDDKPVQ